MYLGNIYDKQYENTYCPKCNALLILRQGYNVKATENFNNGCCIQMWNNNLWNLAIEEITMTRIAAVAGSFYPRKEEEIKSCINEYLKNAYPPQLKGNLKAQSSFHMQVIYTQDTTAGYAYKLMQE